MPTEVQMLEVQGKDPYCRNIRAMVGIEPAWMYSEAMLLCLNSSANGSIQICMPHNY